MPKSPPTYYDPPSITTNDKSRDRGIYEARYNEITGYEFAINRIARHIGKENNVKYVVR